MADAKEYTDADRSAAEVIWDIFARPSMFCGKERWDCLEAFLVGAFHWRTLGRDQIFYEEPNRIWSDFSDWLRKKTHTGSADHPVLAVGRGIDDKEAFAKLLAYYEEWLDAVGIEVTWRR